MNEEQVQRMIDETLAKRIGDTNFSSRLVLQKHLTMYNGNNIEVGKGVGTKIATETDQKLGMYGTTPVVQGSAIGNASGGVVVDTEARSAVNSILTALRNIGIIAT